jgi:hypothetical protein
MGAAALVPLSCCEFCVFGCVVDGLGFGAPEADAVVGGVEIPFCIFSAAGEAMLALAGDVACLSGEVQSLFFHLRGASNASGGPPSFLALEGLVCM